MPVAEVELAVLSFAGLDVLTSSEAGGGLSLAGLDAPAPPEVGDVVVLTMMGVGRTTRTVAGPAIEAKR